MLVPERERWRTKSKITIKMIIFCLLWASRPRTFEAESFILFPRRGTSRLSADWLMKQQRNKTINIFDCDLGLGDLFMEAFGWNKSSSSIEHAHSSCNHWHYQQTLINSPCINLNINIEFPRDLDLLSFAISATVDSTKNNHDFQHSNSIYIHLKLFRGASDKTNFEPNKPKLDIFIALAFFFQLMANERKISISAAG